MHNPIHSLSLPSALELSKIEIHAKSGHMGPYSAQFAGLLALIRKQEAALRAQAAPVVASAPTIKQLAAQLDSDEKWTIAEQNAFAPFLAQFPKECSQGIISLGSAWKHGIAYAQSLAAHTQQPAAVPVQAAVVPDGYVLVPRYDGADAVVSALYRRFKDWSKRGFGPDDVTWCEVKTDIDALISSACLSPAPDFNSPEFEGIKTPTQPPAGELPVLLPGQLNGDTPWLNVQPDAFCYVLKSETVFNGDEILRTWNAMRNALLDTRQPPQLTSDYQVGYTAGHYRGYCMGIEKAAKVCANADKSAHPSDLADAICVLAAAASPAPVNYGLIGKDDDLPAGWTRAADGRVQPPAGETGAAYAAPSEQVKL